MWSRHSRMAPHRGCLRWRQTGRRPEIAGPNPARRRTSDGTPVVRCRRPPWHSCVCGQWRGGSTAETSGPVRRFRRCSLGLSFFAVAGAHKSLTMGNNIEVALLLGTITGVGGGVLRDVLLNRVPHHPGEGDLCARCTGRCGDPGRWAVERLLDRHALVRGIRLSCHPLPCSALFMELAPNLARRRSPPRSCGLQEMSSLLPSTPPCGRRVKGRLPGQERLLATGCFHPRLAGDSMDG